MIHPTIAQALAPFAPANSALNQRPAPDLSDPVRRDEAREALADLAPERDEWGVER